jgi:hypothetical protein
MAAMRIVSTEEARAVLIERAQFWSRLAKEQDDKSTDVEGSIPPTSTPESQPAAQQQQQIQPKDDDKKE